MIFSEAHDYETEVWADIWTKDPVCGDFFKDLRRANFSVEDAVALANLAIYAGTQKVENELKILSGAIDCPQYSPPHPLYGQQDQPPKEHPVLGGAVNRTLNEECY